MESQISNILFNLDNEASLLTLHQDRAAFMLQDVLETDMDGIDPQGERCMIELALQQARTRIEITFDYLRMMHDEISELQRWMDELRQNLKTAQ